MVCYFLICSWPILLTMKFDKMNAFEKLAQIVGF